MGKYFGRSLTPEEQRQFESYKREQFTKLSMIPTTELEGKDKEIHRLEGLLEEARESLKLTTEVWEHKIWFDTGMEELPEDDDIPVGLKKAKETLKKLEARKS